MELADLIKKVEELTSPDRDIDAAVGRCVGMEVRDFRGFYRVKGEGGWVVLADYTTSVDAVIQLIGEKLPGWAVSLYREPFVAPRWTASVTSPGAQWDEAPGQGGIERSLISGVRGMGVQKSTPALALLLAFLRAWETSAPSPKD